MTTVKITRRDITNGSPEDSEACAIARAVKRLVKRNVQVHVLGADGIEFVTKDKTHTRKLNKTALDFIRRFDAGEEVEPTELSINVPEQLLR